MKKRIIAFISAFIIPYIVLAIFIFLVDPYYVFHAPWFQMEPIPQAAHYTARGLIRNLDYDVLLCGTSICENMHTDYIDEVFGSKSIKVVQHGSYSNDLAASLKQSARSGKAQTVIMGLDSNIWKCPSEGYRKENIHQYAVTTPTVINSTSYLFNIDILKPCLELLKANRNGEPDPMNNWWGIPESSYSQERVAAAWQKSKAEGSARETDETLAWENYSNLAEGIKDCADRGILIKFFIPPYSVADLSLYDDYEHELDVYMEIWRELLQYDNVELYAIQFDTDLIQHFEWYRDIIHYNGLVSDMIIDDIADKKFLLTLDNVDEEVDKFNQFLEGYDWEKMEAEMEAILAE